MDKNVKANNQQESKDIREIAEKLNDIKKRSLSDYTYVKEYIYNLTQENRKENSD